jgi:O-antigen/teichoic acid export membrane protein
MATTRRWRATKPVDKILVQNASWMVFAQGGRIFLQTVLFVLIGRALGAASFGMFAGTLGLVLTLAPFAAWGSGNVLIMRVSREPSLFPTYYGNALFITLLSGIFLTILSLILSSVLTPNLPLQLVLFLALSELLFGRILEISGQGFQAFERLGSMAGLNILLSSCRLTAAIGFVVFSPEMSPEVWGQWYLAGTLMAALIAVGWTIAKVGRPRPAPSLVMSELRNGLYFSVALASSSIYTDIDKTMLTRLATPEAAGVYAAAHRVIGMAFIPARSLIYATYPRFFRGGVRGIQGSLAVGKSLLPLSVVAGLAACSGLLLFAPLAPLVLGNEYAATTEAIRVLAAIPLLQSIHYVAADTLAGAGYQGLRSIIQISIAILNIAFNFWLIPHYSWRGAAYASLLSQALLAVTLWMAVLTMVRKTGRQTANSE